MAGAIFPATLFDLPLRQPDARDLRPRINDGGNRLVVHVGGFPRNDLGRDHAFVLGLVRKHRPRNAIADCEHVRQIGSHLIINGDLATLRQRQSQPWRVYSGQRRTSANGRSP